MKARILLLSVVRDIAVVMAVLTSALRPMSTHASVLHASHSNWKPWGLSTVNVISVPPPPNTESAELKAMHDRMAVATESDQAAIAYWNTGSPSYRWVQITLNALKAKPFTNPKNSRALALVNVAIYDALLAAQHAKFQYNRRSPTQIDTTLKPSISGSPDPSYPSDHAVVAGAASVILTYLYPAQSQQFIDQANQAAQSRVVAGVAFPSDVTQGLQLGRYIANQIVDYAKTDRSDTPWIGQIPTDPGKWTGKNPIEPMMGTWRTWVLRAGNELRPQAPPTYNSGQEKKDLAELKTLLRTPQTDSKARFYQSFDGSFTTWYDAATERINDHGLDRDPLAAARTYALLSITDYDALVACWDAKFTYWAARPFQIDPMFQSLFPAPNHPSYPAAHGCGSGAHARILEFLFPNEAKSIHALADEAALSRMWAGIHFRTDINIGLKLGRAVAQKVFDQIKNDGE